jgi:small neutral amino acid transporter SnatA (MarC family)
MLILPLVIVGIISGVALIAGVVAAVCRLLSKSNALSLTLGTLSMPVLIGASLVDWIMTMEADDTAPGNVIIGSMVALAVFTPIALIASHFTIRFLSKRASRNVS